MIGTCERFQLMVADPVGELRRLLPGLWGDDVVVDFDTRWLEHNINWLAPILVIGTLGALVLGIFLAWRSEEMTGVMRVEYKREIITVLRRDINGLPATRLAKELKISLAKTALLLEEMEKDNLLQVEVFNGKTVFRVRGVFGNSRGSH